MPLLYSFVDILTGTQYVGCMQEVYGAKVELEAVQQPGGFGGVKMTGEALPALPVLGRAGLRGQGSSLRLRRPALLDCSDEGQEGLRAFDLRDV